MERDPAGLAQAGRRRIGRMDSGLRRNDGMTE
jgi:hypothetical protein